MPHLAIRKRLTPLSALEKDSFPTIYQFLRFSNSDRITASALLSNHWNYCVFARDQNRSRRAFYCTRYAREFQPAW